MFDQNTVMTERPMGQEEGQQPPADRLAAPATNPQPSVQSTEPGLAWWDAMKYFWKRNARGNGAHLAPQDAYTDSVIDRANVWVEAAAKELSEDDLEKLDRVSGLLTDLIQEFQGLDSSGIEAAAWRRFILNRAAIARKVCGSNAVSAEHRLINARQTGKSDDEIDAMKADTSASGYYCADIEKRNRWADKTCTYEYLSEKLADGDVIPTSNAAFVEKQETAIRRSVYDDAVDHGNKLKRPVQQVDNTQKAFTREELLAMTA